MKLRQPIITFMGHIDHGKTSLQDFIRQTSTAQQEAGKITQHIGCSNITLETVKKLCGKLLDTLKLKLTIPGLLFIDSPGHAAFTSLRKRGGNLADIAILVIDINEGVMLQTLECIDILKQYKTPFIIALNKIDLIPGWQPKNTFLIQDISSQSETIQKILDTKLYELVGKLSELSFNAERFDRVEDYTKQIAIVPTSAKTGEGIPELLMVLTGLAQKFMEQRLNVNIEGNARGTVLEVKEDKGRGKTIDVIIYNGTLKKNDTVVIGTLTDPISTKVKALLEPLPLKDIRDKKTKFTNVSKVSAATGIKISAPDIENVVAGMPLISCSKIEIEKVKQEIKKEVEEVIIETDKEGIVIKADSLGSLEAVIKLLKEKNISVKRASIGDISNQSDIERASKQFRDLKKSVVGFMGAFKSLLWQDNNIVSAYALFNGSRTLENYDSAREVIEETISDCEEIVSQSNSNIKGNGWGTITKFARDIQLNAEYYFLKMGYDMLHDGDARKKLHDPEQFEQDLMTKARKMIYFPVTKLSEVPSVIQLSAKERAFYDVELKPKPS